MDDRAVLNVGPVPDPDYVDVATHGAPEPDAAFTADDHVTDHHRVRGDEGVGGDRGVDVLIRLDHLCRRGFQPRDQYAPGRRVYELTLTPW